MNVQELPSRLWKLYMLLLPIVQLLSHLHKHLLNLLTISKSCFKFPMARMIPFSKRMAHSCYNKIISKLPLTQNQKLVILLNKFSGFFICFFCWTIGYSTHPFNYYGQRLLSLLVIPKLFENLFELNTNFSYFFGLFSPLFLFNMNRLIWSLHGISNSNSLGRVRPLYSSLKLNCLSIIKPLVHISQCASFCYQLGFESYRFQFFWHSSLSIDIVCVTDQLLHVSFNSIGSYRIVLHLYLCKMFLYRAPTAME